MAETKKAEATKAKTQTADEAAKAAEEAKDPDPTAKVNVEANEPTEKKIENVDDITLEELRKQAEKAGVSRSGTKQEIADRINEQSSEAGAKGEDASSSKGVDSGNADTGRVEPEGAKDQPQVSPATG